MVCGCCDRNAINNYWLQCISNASPPIISISIAFAAGAILVMLGETMIPEAFKRESFGKGVALLAGFVIAVLLTKAQGG